MNLSRESIYVRNLCENHYYVKIELSVKQDSEVWKKVGKV